MPPKPQGLRALTNAERQARIRARQAKEALTLKLALRRIQAEAKTIREAREIAADALVK